MKDLNINRDKTQPSDEELLKHQNFGEVLKKASGNTAISSTKTGKNNWWVYTVGGVFVLGFVVLVLFNTVNKTNDFSYQYLSVNQEFSDVEKLQDVNLGFLNNISSDNSAIDSAQNVVKTQEINEPENNVVDNPVTIEYFYPKEASTLTFKLEESFGLEKQYQNFEEFSIYDNLAFQPIGDYQSGWLKASWNKVELVKKNGNYFLMLSKNGLSLPCQVIPVFESEDYVKALEVYTNAKTK